MRAPPLLSRFTALTLIAAFSAGCPKSPTASRTTTDVVGDSRGNAPEPDPAPTDDVSTAERPGGTVPPPCAATTLYFEFDSWQLDEASATALRGLAECLARRPPGTVHLEGHADDRGTAQYNVALSSRRANSTWSYLMQLGAPGRADVVAKGEESPAVEMPAGANEATREAVWAKNRRVEITVE
jgi:peptidoglycan-associated lipoprotein